jgi:hypothetical protein
VSPFITDIFAAQQACLDAMRSGDGVRSHVAWQRYDEQIRRMPLADVAPGDLRRLLVGHRALEEAARAARDKLAEQRQTMTRQQDADRAYRSSQAGTVQR